MEWVIAGLGLLISAAATGYSIYDTAVKEGRRDLLTTDAFKIAQQIYKKIDNAGQLESLINKLLNSDTTTISGITNYLSSSPWIMSIIDSYNDRISKLNSSKTTEKTKYTSESTSISSEIKSIDNQLSAIYTAINNLASYASGRKSDDSNRRQQLSSYKKQAADLVEKRDQLEKQLQAVGSNYTDTINNLNLQYRSSSTQLATAANTVNFRSRPTTSQSTGGNTTTGTSVSTVMNVPNTSTGGK